MPATPRETEKPLLSSRAQVSTAGSLLVRQLRMLVDERHRAFDQGRWAATAAITCSSSLGLRSTIAAILFAWAGALG